MAATSSLPPDYPQQHASATERANAFRASLAPDVLAREDALPATLGSMNASAKSKLRRIYALSDELAGAREQFTACQKGCANCCHMNVTISTLEAEQIAAASGRRAVPVTRSKPHPVGTFAGVDCPFLVESVCSVYQDRPLACRSHASYYTSSFACDTVNMPVTDAPMVNFLGLTEALGLISEGKGSAVFADIRDFFPSQA